MPRSVEMILASVAAVVLALSFAARRFPAVAWLQAFRFDPPQLREEQRARMRRRANIYAGIELILLGLVLPIGYLALTLMFFNSITTAGVVLTALGSLLCIGLGITAIAKNR
ncbi:MAG: hypothetical protein ACRENB_05345 [Gemmatimonadales bacterium]